MFRYCSFGSNNQDGDLDIVEAPSSMIPKSPQLLPSNIAPDSELDEEDKFDRLLHWMLKNGAKMDQLYLEYYEFELRGVCMKNNAPTNTCVLTVPLGLIMTTDLAKQTRIGRAICRSDVCIESTHSYLACMLMSERRDPLSYWKPYIDILPQEYRNMPINFTDDELSYLKGSFAIDKLANQRRSLTKEFENLLTHVFEFARMKPAPTLQEFIWARSAVITRIFGFNIDGRSSDGLVPMADMLNHSLDKDVSWTFHNGIHAFTMTAHKPLMKGQELYDSYGVKCNSRFLVNYGFALEGNIEHNEAVVQVFVNQNDVWFDSYRHHHLLKPSPNRRYQIGRDYHHKETTNMFSTLRYIVSNDEYYVLQLLRQCCVYSLSLFETTIEEDARIIREDLHLSRNQRNCVIMRHGEKEILWHYINMVDICSSVMQTRPHLSTLVSDTKYQPYIVYLRSVYSKF